MPLYNRAAHDHFHFSGMDKFTEVLESAFMVLLIVIPLCILILLVLAVLVRVFPPHTTTEKGDSPEPRVWAETFFGKTDFELMTVGLWVDTMRCIDGEVWINGIFAGKGTSWKITENGVIIDGALVPKRRLIPRIKSE